ncbi:MAG: hypothetical protein PHD29_08595 [bacterium]|nr:hypothetical protein [bacterium]MDD5756436.1 hypothetical protein [bacterium]
MALPTAGGAPPNKKKIFLLLGLGLVIIIVYKFMVFSPPAPPLEVPSVDSDTTSGIQPPLERENFPVKNEQALSQEKIDTSGQFWGRDPFVGDTAGEASRPATTAELPKSLASEEQALVLSGIAWSKNKAVAIINGQVVREGDLLQAKGKKIYKVITILKNRVILQGHDKTITLRVRGG